MKKRCAKPRSGGFVCYAVTFGVGLTLSCFCPKSLILFIAAVIIVALGICAVRCKT